VSGHPEVAPTDVPASDAELLAAVSARDQKAFAELLKRHHGLVFRVAWRVTGGREADDIAQETFIKLWRNPEQVRDGASLRSWLLRVASNAAIDRARRRKPESLDVSAEISDGRANAEETLQQSAATGAVDRAIAALPERQRLALTLVYFEGQSNIEAAAAMNATVEAVESLLSRARRTLKQSLSGEWQDLLGSLAGDGA
jgi:RNA polymerase sigma-70 factor (ECF subfamily)